MDPSIQRLLAFWNDETATAEANHKTVQIAPAEFRVLLNLIPVIPPTHAFHSPAAEVNH